MVFKLNCPVTLKFCGNLDGKEMPPTQYGKKTLPGSTLYYAFYQSGETGMDPAPEPGEEVSWFAPEDADRALGPHKTLHGETPYTIEQRQSKGGKVWVITNEITGDASYSDRPGLETLDHPAVETLPTTTEAARTDQPATQPKATERLPVGVPVDTPARIGATYVVAGKIVEAACALLGWDGVTEDQKMSTATGFLIDLKKEGWQPRPEAVTAFIQVMKQQSAHFPPPSAPDPEPAAPEAEALAVIGGDGVFALMQAAKEAGVTEHDLWKHMAQVWRGHLNIPNSSPLPQTPGTLMVDFTQFPQAVEDVVDAWLTAKRNILPY